MVASGQVKFSSLSLALFWLRLKEEAKKKALSLNQNFGGDKELQHLSSRDWKHPTFDITSGYMLVWEVPA